MIIFRYDLSDSLLKTVTRNHLEEKVAEADRQTDRFKPAKQGAVAEALTRLLDSMIVNDGKFSRLPGIKAVEAPARAQRKPSVQTARKPPVAMKAKHVLGRKNVTTGVVVPRRGRRVPLAEQAPNVPVTVGIAYSPVAKPAKATVLSAQKPAEMTPPPLPVQKPAEMTPPSLPVQKPLFVLESPAAQLFKCSDIAKHSVLFISTVVYCCFTNNFAICVRTKKPQWSGRGSR